MSRDDGFPRADVDTSYFDDEKMRDLWQRLRDPIRMQQAATLHMATLLMSWRQGKRVTVTQAAPTWCLADADVIEALQAVGLLDDERRIPLHAWDGWYGPASARRRAKSVGGLAGANKRWDRAKSPKGSATGSADGSADGNANAPTNHPSNHPSNRPSNRTQGATTRGRTTTDCVVCRLTVDETETGVTRTPSGYVHAGCLDAYRAGATRSPFGELEAEA